MIEIKAKVIAPKSKKYNSTELKKGVKVEAEHTPNKKLKTIIAKNHLDEDKHYYKKLAKIEKKK